MHFRTAPCISCPGCKASATQRCPWGGWGGSEQNHTLQEGAAPACRHHAQQPPHPARTAGAAGQQDCTQGQEIAGREKRQPAGQAQHCLPARRGCEPSPGSSQEERLRHGGLQVLNAAALLLLPTAFPARCVMGPGRKAVPNLFSQMTASGWMEIMERKSPALEMRGQQTSAQNARLYQEEAVRTAETLSCPAAPSLQPALPQGQHQLLTRGGHRYRVSPQGTWQSHSQTSQRRNQRTQPERLVLQEEILMQPRCREAPRWLWVLQDDEHLPLMSCSLISIRPRRQIPARAQDWSATPVCPPAFSPRWASGTASHPTPCYSRRQVGLGVQRPSDWQALAGSPSSRKPGRQL